MSSKNPFDLIDKVILCCIIVCFLALIAILVLMLVPNIGTTPSTTKTEEKTTQQPKETNQQLTASSCVNFADALGTCSVFTCTYTHPFTKEEMTKKIIGKNGNACHYEEQLPNNGLLTCNYPLESLANLKIATQDLSSGDVDEKSSTKLNLQGQNETVSTYTLPSGETKTNYVDLAANDPTQCKVTGYGN